MPVPTLPEHVAPDRSGAIGTARPAPLGPVPRGRAAGDQPAEPVRTLVIETLGPRKTFLVQVDPELAVTTGSETGLDLLIEMLPMNPGAIGTELASLARDGTSHARGLLLPGAIRAQVLHPMLADPLRAGLLASESAQTRAAVASWIKGGELRDIGAVQAQAPLPARGPDPAPEPVLVLGVPVARTALLLARSTRPHILMMPVAGGSREAHYLHTGDAFLPFDRAGGLQPFDGSPKGPDGQFPFLVENGPVHHKALAEGSRLLGRDAEGSKLAAAAMVLGLVEGGLAAREVAGHAPSLPKALLGSGFLKAVGLAASLADRGLRDAVIHLFLERCDEAGRVRQGLYMTHSALHGAAMLMARGGVLAADRGWAQRHWLPGARFSDFQAFLSALPEMPGETTQARLDASRALGRAAAAPLLRLLDEMTEAASRLAAVQMAEDSPVPALFRQPEHAQLRFPILSWMMHDLSSCLVLHVGADPIQCGLRHGPPVSAHEQIAKTRRMHALLGAFGVDPAELTGLLSGTRV